MQSFRTELENPVVEKDILELEKKIRLFKEGKLDEESFRSLRLARGVYGQRQKGVQMVRIKFPLGIIRPEQWRRMAEMSEKYADGNVHLTTRQDIQLHHVSLDETPQLWAELEEDEITMREACGNTVRNITGSPFAGIDPVEPFDVTPYGWTLFEHFLRNPIGQELGRKFKIAISASDEDDVRAYLHDLGLIPKFKNGQKGFKVLLGGGLGAQPFVASVVKDFLPVDQLVNYATAALKVFDQYGERNRRNKARLKYLIKDKGIDFVKDQIENEFQSFTTEQQEWLKPKKYYNAVGDFRIEIPLDDLAFENWKKTNVFNQKNSDLKAVLVKVKNGNLQSSILRELANLIGLFSQEESRLTIEQNILIRSVPEKYLPNLFNGLFKLSLADFGGGSIRDITSCPGTQTCNLGITATYEVSEVINQLLIKEYPKLIFDNPIQIKISGCMNACGQHTVADIGFHGSSIKADGKVYPALQLLLGGKNLGNGEAVFAEKVIKVPTKRVENLLRLLLDDYDENKGVNETFHAYYQGRGKIHFYDLLKPLANLSEADDDTLIDWGAKERFLPQIGVGECAGVKIDLVKTLIFEAEEKVEEARYFLENNQRLDALYTLYSALIQGAKALLVQKGEKTNSKNQIEEAFEVYFSVFQNELKIGSFSQFIQQSKTQKSSIDFVENYLGQTRKFLNRINQLTDDNKS